MRALLPWVVGLALCAPAHADLFTAQLAYHKGDYQRAFKDYRELAELGQPVAQYNLAIMYEQGLGVRRSELNAYAWAMLAYRSGYTRGKELADKLRPGLAPGSEKIAEDIVSSPRPCAASRRRSRQRRDCSGISRGSRSGWPVIRPGNPGTAIS